MKINLGPFDRILRFILGVILFAWAWAGGPAWGYFGAYLILSGAWGFCIFYSFFRYRSIAIDEPGLGSKNNLVAGDEDT